MIIRNVKETDLTDTLLEINRKYNNNVMFNRFEKINSNAFRITLRVKDSKNAGHRLGYSTTKNGKHRRLTNACWHVHGDFFDVLLKINSNAVILTNNRKIDKNGGNWEDWNIGSIMYPLYYSEACECDIMGLLT